jgi:hypothetical protein
MSELTVSRASGWVRPGKAGPAWLWRHRIAAASAMLAAGVLQTIEDVVEPTHEDPTARFEAMARDATPFEVSKLFGITALPFLMVTAVVLWAMARGRMPRLAFTAGAMVFAGFIGLSVLQGVETVEIVALKGGLGVADVQRIDDGVTGSVAGIPIVVMFLSLLIGLLLLTVALWRARTVPRIALLLIVAFLAADFGVLGALPFPVHVIWLAALAWIAWSVLIAAPTPTDQTQTDR